MARSFRPALGSLGIALLLVEFFILSLGIFRPHVSEAYYDFYISRTRSCYLPPDATQRAEQNLQKTQIAVAALDADTACYLLKSGWDHVEPWGVWSLGKHASIELPIAPGEAVLQLTIRGFSKANDQRTKVYIGNEFIGQFNVPNAISTNIRLAIPPGTGGVMIISFQIAEPTAPAAVIRSNDIRKIGIGLIAIERE